MEWVEIFKRHSTPSHENQEERVVTYSYVSSRFVQSWEKRAI